MTGRPSVSPTNGVIENCPTTVASVGSVATTSTSSRRSPISSSASRNAASRSSRSTAGSTLPPGKAISPRCDGMVSGRRVEDEADLGVLLEQREQHRGGPSPGSERRRRGRDVVGELVADAIERDRPGPDASEAQGAAAPARAVAGLGMRWRPPRAPGSRMVSATSSCRR